MGPDCSRCSVNIISYYYYYHYYCQASRISPYLYLLISVIKGAVRNIVSLALKWVTSLILWPIVPTWCELEGHRILMRITFCPSDCSHASLRAQAWALSAQSPLISAGFVCLKGKVLTKGSPEAACDTHARAREPEGWCGLLSGPLGFHLVHSPYSIQSRVTLAFLLLVASLSLFREKRMEWSFAFWLSSCATFNLLPESCRARGQGTWGWGVRELSFKPWNCIIFDTLQNSISYLFQWFECLGNIWHRWLQIPCSDTENNIPIVCWDNCLNSLVPKTTGWGLWWPQMLHRFPEGWWDQYFIHLNPLTGKLRTR